MVNFGEVRRAQLAKSTSTTCPLDLFRTFKVCSYAREWSAESNEKLPHLFIPSKTTTLVPEFAVADLPFGRTADLMPELAVKNLPLGKSLMSMMLKQLYYRLHFVAVKLGLSP